MGTVRHRAKPAVASMALVLLLAAAAPAFAQEQVSIAQIDPSRLLTRQEVDVYVGVAGPDGNAVTGLDAGDFSMSEGLPGKPLLPVSHFSFHEGAPANEGLAFFLLVDNSGSMYEPLDTSPDGERQQTRIEAARSAIRVFLNSVDNPADRIGLASFNTLYRVEALPTRMRSETEAALARIARPAEANSYTELYASIKAAARDLSGWKGRKVIILLTDGENYPYALHTGKPNPQFGSTLVSSDEAVHAIIREGISVFPIQFGPDRQDSDLQTIARQTGGRVFDARSESGLAKVYLAVRRRVLEEYRLTYSPRMIPGDRREVHVEYHGPGGTASASQYYFVGTLFGPPAGRLSPLIAIPFLIALFAWYLISKARFLNRRKDANLEVLGAGATKVFSLNEGKTVIGFDATRRITVTSEEEGKGKQQGPAAGKITVVKDERTGSFTVVSEDPVMVNNRPVQRRLLRPGDVLRIGEATIVFDDRSPEEKQGPKQ